MAAEETEQQTPEEIRERLISDIFARSYLYHDEHGIRDSDIDKAERIIRARQAMNFDTPCPGDLVICKGPNKTYERGHLESACGPDSYSNICTQPYIPFVFIRRDDKGICCDTSGGYWLTCKDGKKLNPVGKSQRDFKTWGHCGPTGNGAFNFPIIVSVWEYYSDKIY